MPAYLGTPFPLTVGPIEYMLALCLDGQRADIFATYGDDKETFERAAAGLPVGELHSTVPLMTIDVPPDAFEALRDYGIAFDISPSVSSLGEKEDRARAALRSLAVLLKQVMPDA